MAAIRNCLQIGEEAWQFRALAILAEDLGSVPTPSGQLRSTSTQFPGYSMPSSGVEVHACKILIHIKINKAKKKKKPVHSQLHITHTSLWWSPSLLNRRKLREQLKPTKNAETHFCYRQSANEVQRGRTEGSAFCMRRQDLETSYLLF